MNPIIVKVEEKCNIVYDLDNLEIIGKGGYGSILQLDDNKVIKVGNKGNEGNKGKVYNGGNRDYENECLYGKGCKNDIFMEGAILNILSIVNSEHIAKFYGLYYCEDRKSYALIMEYIHGNTFTTIQSKINMKQRLSILFQLTYTLYDINKYCKFVHGDMIGQNIMISKVPEVTKVYHIIDKEDKENKEYKVLISNNGIHVHIIDFGFSRLEYKDQDTTPMPMYTIFNENSIKTTSPELLNLMSPENRFDPRADICKIYANPNFSKVIDYSSVQIKGIKLSNIISSCKTTGWSYVAIPPFPNITHVDLLLSTLWDPIKLNF